MAGRFGYPEYPDHFKPTFHPERLEEPYKLKKPAKIFVCSMGELFGPWVPWDWIWPVLMVAKGNPHHIFQFLTKHPDGMRGIRWPGNVWIGTTITWWDESDRADILADITAPIRFVSAEPLLSYLPWAPLAGIDWLVIGAQTNPHKQPDKRWVADLLEGADSMGIPVFMKSNLDYEPKRREFPHDS